MFSTYPTKKSPVNPEQQRGQTSPGLKTQETGLVSGTYPGKGGNGFKLDDTTAPGSGKTSYPKKGMKQSRPGTAIDNAVPRGDMDSDSCCDLMAKPKAM